jgi:hypothetical protein
VSPVWDAEPHKRHGSDVAADGLLDPCFLLGKAGLWPVAVEPGREQLGGQLLALDEVL